MEKYDLINSVPIHNNDIEIIWFSTQLQIGTQCVNRCSWHFVFEIYTKIVKCGKEFLNTRISKFRNDFSDNNRNHAIMHAYKMQLKFGSMKIWYLPSLINQQSINYGMTVTILKEMA